MKIIFYIEDGKTMFQTEGFKDYNFDSSTMSKLGVIDYFWRLADEEVNYEYTQGYCDAVGYESKVEAYDCLLGSEESSDAYEALYDCWILQQAKGITNIYN